MSATNRELADFLRRVRSSRDPREAGVPDDGRVRRVPGLRREEVALLAGVSADYYTRLEQGRRITPSGQVVDAIARALGLDDAGHAHLRDLIGATSARPPRRPSVQRVRPGLHQLIDSLDGHPVLVLGRRTQILASNRLARALFTDFEQMPAKDRNYARWMLLSPEARDLFIDWESQARNAVESLRFDAGRNNDDPEIRQLVGELSLASGEFRQWWAQHRVHRRTFGTKALRHPLVGDLTVDFESLTFPGDGEQTMFIYSTPPDSPSRQALNMLASWAQPAATPPA